MLLRVDELRVDIAPGRRLLPGDAVEHGDTDIEEYQRLRWTIGVRS